MSDSQQSYVLDMIGRARKVTCSGMASWSWDRHNHMLQSMLYALIRGGCRFERTDFDGLIRHHAASRWLGAEIEWYYAAAVKAGNISAALAFEAWVRRKPFFFARRANTGGVAKDRIAVGSPLLWGGVCLKVTSFAQDGQSLIACLYKHRESIDDPPVYPDRPVSRVRITRAELVAHAKALKAARLAAQSAVEG